MNYDLAVVSSWQKTCLFYPHGTGDKIQNDSVPVSLINRALEKPWVQNYLADDKFVIRSTLALKIRSPMSKKFNFCSHFLHLNVYEF